MQALPTSQPTGSSRIFRPLSVTGIPKKTPHTRLGRPERVLRCDGPIPFAARARTHRLEAPRGYWIGLEFLGPQAPDGRPSASAQPEVPNDTLNLPTYHTRRQSSAKANRQLDYVFASRGFHEVVTARALNDRRELAQVVDSCPDAHENQLAER